MPLPDAVHYINPARSLLQGYGFKIVYEGRIINPGVPPLYSLFLVPFFAFSTDARSFYLANVLLTLFSVGLFYLILKRLKLSPFVVILSFFAFVTNNIVYWYPSFPMSENLFLFLYLLSIWLLLCKVKVWNIVTTGFVIISFYATKYVEIVLSLVLGLVYLFKIFRFSLDKSKIYLYFPIFVISVIIPLLLFYASEYLNKGSHIWPLVYLSGLSKSGLVTTVSSIITPNPSYFSFNNVFSNAIQYLAGFMGGELRIAGQGMIVMSPIIGMIGLVGLLFNPIISKFKLISVYLLMSVAGVFTFACFFYLTEGRYLFFAIPVIILSFALFVDRLWSLFRKIGKDYLIYLSAAILLILILFSQIPSVFKQLKSGYGLMDTNTNYLAIDTINKYFINVPDLKKTAVISILPPYVFDYYNKSNFTLLPLSHSQAFISSAEITWGQNDYADLIRLYRKYLDSGYSLYVSAFKTDPSYLYYYNFQKINNNFALEKVADGCEGRCNLYKISLK